MNTATPVNPLTHPRSELAAAHLQKRYGKRTVVKDVSFCVRSGEVVGLLGPNGAGKTTCFYMVVGLVGADKGDVTLTTSASCANRCMCAHATACRICRKKPRFSAN